MTSAELERIHAEISMLIADTVKLNAENRKMSKEVFWYPVAVSTGLITAVATLTTFLLKLI